MIKTKLAYDNIEIYINPYTISYITRDKDMDETVIGLTNGHTYIVSASVSKLLEGINNETKSLCEECKTSIRVE